MENHRVAGSSNRNGLAKVRRPLFCAEYIVYLSMGNCMGKASRHIIVTFEQRRMRTSFYAAVSLTLIATAIYSKHF